MPRPQPKPIKTEKDAYRSISELLKTAVRAPDINSYHAHNKQIDFHKSQAFGRQFLGGNRSGKTFGGGAEMCFQSKIVEDPFKPVRWDEPTRGRIIGVDFTQGIEKIIFPIVKQLIPKSALQNGSWDRSFDKELRTLYLANGSEIEFMSYEQDLEKFAGTSRHWIWFDEEPPKEIFTECMLRLLDTNGIWWMTMTPVEGMTWTYDDVYTRHGVDPNIYVVEVDTDDNPHIGQDEKDRIFGSLSEEDRQARKQGRYISLGGVIYPEFNPDVHIIDPISTPPGWMRFDSMDHGYTNPTAWLFNCVDREGRIIVLDEHYKNKMIISQHAQIVLEKDKEYGFPLYRVGDPSIANIDPITSTSVQIEYVEHGVPILLAARHSGSVTAGINIVKTKLIGVGDRPQLYICRNCVNLIWEIRRYRWAMWAHKQTNYEKNRKEEPQKKDDHACDALRYGVASRPEVEDFSVPEHLPLPDGASEAIEPDKPFIDKEVTSVGQKYSDYNMGEEY